ncbi:NACHT domain-containing protein [Bradyrhizobium roseum]|uniref:hypothetical protein n=1 Tax=Bradyrhizobium roseum TaxID=3056648 RepID=UPI002625B8C4|nr:hypothetical protein [Bradyrhizobium roseus]WKA29779.1 hypothetical protein QUH67_06270 [Bradyrhizobium roseus]
MPKKKKTSSGGKAEASGGNYETLVATWYAHAALLGGGAHPPFDLDAGTQIVSFACQSEAPVDDVNAVTSHAGIIFVQAKRSVAMSSAATSSFAGALDQFVRQIKASAAADSKHAWSRPLDSSRDRLVLATPSTSSSKVIVTLPELLRRVRDRSDVRTLKQVAVSQSERDVAKTVETNLKRSWKAAYRKSPTDKELNALLRLIWVHQLDLESGGRDRKFILEQFRANLLEDATQASLAVSELFKLAARLRAERSGADRSTLLQLLARAGIRLTALPDFRGDVAALRRWTAARLEPAPSFTRLLADDPKLTIERAAWPEFRDAATSQSLLLVGEPGAGKSGLMYRLAATAIAAQQDVVFLPVDLLNVDTFSGLHAELGISHGLVEVLDNWPGSKPGLLILDALDAARKPETQKLLREVVGAVLRLPGSRWRVIASVRKYDLRQGTEWSMMFRGQPPIPAQADREFSRVCHVSVGRLADHEILQIAELFPALGALYSAASPKLRDLLQNIFNLHLLADLLRAGVAGSDLSAITTQSELLDSYWRHRIRRADGKHDSREATLTTVVNAMIDAQVLRVLRADVRTEVDTDALVDLERNGILRAEDQGGQPDESVLLFNHHVLFDYAVARLVFGRGRDAVRLVALLRARRELSLMLSPSLVLALSDAWNTGDGHALFWNLAFALGQETGLPGVALLVAPMVAVEQTRDLGDLQPIFDALNGPEPRKSAAEQVVQNMIGALFVRKNAGVPLLGPDAGPWMQFAERLAAIGSDRLMLALRALIATAVEAL